MLKSFIQTGRVGSPNIFYCMSHKRTRVGGKSLWILHSSETVHTVLYGLVGVLSALCLVLRKNLIGHDGREHQGKA